MANVFEPTNTLEIYLQRAMAGEVSMEEFVSVLVKSELYMPCVTEPKKDMSNFMPLVFDKDGQPMAAVFTNLKLMELYKEHLKGNIAMNGGALLSRSAPGYGLVINPGYTLGLEIDENGIKNIVSKFVENNENA